MMTPTRWRQIKDIYTRIIAVPEEQRIGALDSACGPDSSLKEELVKLLSPDKEALDLLEGARVTPWTDLPELELGATIDSFTLVEKLGSGGMGTVYKATREQTPGALTVAIKYLSRSDEKGRTSKYFRKEAEILSYLNHPNIAKCFLGGRLDDGHPYFVMEFVDGIAIDQYCLEQQLAIPDRLRLLIQVCKAVEYAHRNLIVHCDLKPSNILVTEEGVVKLLDFGIAKILTVDSGTANTDVSSLWGPMTMGYASPEQMLGGSVTTGSDVFSLGVLLHELLTGFLVNEAGAVDCFQARKSMLEGHTLPPSETVRQALGETKDAEFLQSYTTSMDLSPRQLLRVLKGDLDQIVLKAVAVDQQDRYANVNVLGSDLQRYLNGYPLSIGGESPLRLLGKWIRRNKVVCLAGASFLLLIFSSVIGLMIQKRQVTQQWQRAEANLKRAEATSAYLQKIFENADPYHADGADFSARDLLDQGLAALPGALAEDPRSKASILHTMAGTYQVLADHGTAQKLYEEALTIRRQELGDHNPKTAETLFGLATALAIQDDLARAEQAIAEALAISSRIHGEDHPKIASMLGRSAVIALARGDRQTARASFERGLEILAKPADDDQRALRANLLHDFGKMLSAEGEFLLSKQRYTESLDIKRNLLGPDHPGIGNTLNDLAILNRKIGRLDEAEDLLTYSHYLTLTHLGRHHPKSITVANNLASLLVAQGKYQEAEQLLSGLLREINILKIEDAHLRRTLMLNYSTSLIRQNHLVEAEPWLVNALEELEQMAHPPRNQRLVTLSNLAVLHRKLGQPDRADRLFDRAQGFAESDFGSEHPFTARILSYRAKAYIDLACSDHAVDAYRRSFAILAEKRGLHHLETVTCFRDWAKLVQATAPPVALDSMVPNWSAIRAANRDTAPPRLRQLLDEIAPIFQKMKNGR